MKVLDQVKAARRVSAPVLVINTPDPAATIASVVDGVNGNSPKICWDFVSGVKPLNEAGMVAINTIEAESTICNPGGLLVECLRLPEGTIVFVQNAHRFLNDDGFVQGVWNLRDQFKCDRRTLILLGPHVDVPVEISNDVVLMDEALPDRETIRELVREVHTAAQLEVSAETVEKAADATQGLSAFQVEQTVAMSLTPDGLVLDDLWERKRHTIEQTPGLTVWRGGETFDDLGGLQQVKDFSLAMMRGKAAPNCVVFVDEIEKAMAGVEGDTSGVSQDQLGVLLSYMQDKQQVGSLFLGPPGSGKSAIAKSLGNECDVPTIQFDLGAMKGSLVGQSEQHIRQAVKVVEAVSGGRAFWVATCNKISAIKPELRRRFSKGTFFFDLPDDEERSTIWSIYRAGYNLGDDTSFEQVDDAGWTGAEIRECCDTAWRTGLTIEQSSAFIVPVCRSAAKDVDKLRGDAEGCFLSASQRGVYSLQSNGKTKRRFWQSN